MTSAAPPPGDALPSAGEHVARACRLIKSPTPESLDESAAALEAAATELAAWRAHPPLAGPARQEALAHILKLRFASNMARTMLESSASYHRNWICRLGTLSAGYTGDGRPAGVPTNSRLSVQG